ncbi:MAG: PEP-CTERM sorting domain-containing protein [Planctomycetes bacterium]|nr:PEP-CTERM sorting domain-containing protein [Planctomycetota bacterium]
MFDGVNSVFDHLDDFFGNFPWESPAGGNGGLHLFQVPEPSTCLLTMLGCVACLWRRRSA